MSFIEALIVSTVIFMMFVIAIGVIWGLLYLATHGYFIIACALFATMSILALATVMYMSENEDENRTQYERDASEDS